MKGHDRNTNDKNKHNIASPVFILLTYKPHIHIQFSITAFPMVSDIEITCLMLHVNNCGTIC